MRIILLGPPGCGKGTQANLLTQHRGLRHISTGNILREAKQNGTPTGKRAQLYMDEGKLVPDDLVIELVEELFRKDRPLQFMLDGYPRTLEQARVLEEHLHRLALPLTDVVLLEVDEEEVLKRITGRWTCPNVACGATYHITNHPPKEEGICDHCGSELKQRADDKEETIRDRFKIYHQETAELIPYYERRGLLRHVPGVGAIDDIHLRILKALQPQAGASC